MASTRTHVKRPLTAEDLFRIEVISDPQVSPDGSRIAWVQTRPDKDADLYKAALWIANADGSNVRKLSSGAHRDQSPRWSPDSATLAFVSNRPSTLPSGEQEDGKGAESNAKPLNQVWTIRVDGGEAVQRTAHPQGASDPCWSPDGLSLAYVAADDVREDDGFDAPTSVGPIADERVVHNVSYRFDGKGFLERYNHLWVHSLESGKCRQLTFGNANDSAPAWSPDGESIAFSGNRSPERARHWNRQQVHVIPSHGGEVRTLTPDDAVFGLPRWSPNGDRIAVIGHLGTASNINSGVWTIEPESAAMAEETEGQDYSFGDLGMSDLLGSGDNGPKWRDEGSVYVLAPTRGETQVFRINVGKRAVDQVTAGKHFIAGFAFLGDDLAVVRGTIDRPLELERWAEGRLGDPFSKANADLLAEVDLVAAIDLEATAPDGGSVQSWVLPPLGFDPGSGVKHPLILQIHGGPHSMYGYGMFHEMQLMAARGYAVVFSNPRGSNGYGQEFTACTRGIWGEADMPDVIAALEAACDLGWVDTDRLGITGGSYGGYLTNWIIGHDDRFKAAVTQRCVSNFYSFFGTSDIGTTFGVHEFDGLPWSDAEKLLRHSPISYVDQITTPLLILHSERDLRCPIEQAEQLYAAMKYLEREVAFVRIPEEGHELSRSGTPSRRMARLHHLVGWFDAHL